MQAYKVAYLHCSESIICCGSKLEQVLTTDNCNFVVVLTTDNRQLQLHIILHEQTTPTTQYNQSMDAKQGTHVAKVGVIHLKFQDFALASRKILAG